MGDKHPPRPEQLLPFIGIISSYLLKPTSNKPYKELLISQATVEIRYNLKKSVKFFRAEEIKKSLWSETMKFCVIN